MHTKSTVVTFNVDEHYYINHDTSTCDRKDFHCDTSTSILSFLPMSQSVSWLSSTALLLTVASPALNPATPPTTTTTTTTAESEDTLSTVVALCNYRSVKGYTNDEYITYIHDRSCAVFPLRNVQIGNKRVGFWQRYFATTNQLESQGYYNDDGKKEGEWKECYGNACYRISDYVDGMKWAISNCYYGDGRLLSESNYLKDMLNGDYKEYYWGGQLQTQGEYSNGKKSGCWSDYYSNGKLHRCGRYHNDRRCGNWKLNFEDGQLFEWLDYDDIDSS